MTVGELIKILSTKSKDAEVSMGIDDASDNTVLIIYDNEQDADKQTKIFMD